MKPIRRLLSHSSILPCRQLRYRHVHNIADASKYDKEMPHNLRVKVLKLKLDADGFSPHYKKQATAFTKKTARNAHHMKTIKAKVENSERLSKDKKLLDQHGGLALTQSNIRKVRKTAMKESTPDDISPDQAVKYLQILKGIREGLRNPEQRMFKVKKSPSNSEPNKTAIKLFTKRIKALHIASHDLSSITKCSELPSKSIIDKQFACLDAIYDEICALNQSNNTGNTANAPIASNTVMHLDLHSRILLSYGKLGRLHKMFQVYRELKSHNLHVTNAVLIRMLDLVQGQDNLLNPLWTEYINDFRKGKIAERPTRELFNALIRSFVYAPARMRLADINMLFRMMTQEFHIAPDADTMMHMLTAYKKSCPPCYKSAQKLIAKMRQEYAVPVEARHYASVLNTWSLRWGHFGKLYKETEDVDDKFLMQFKGGVDFERCLQLFHRIVSTKKKHQVELVSEFVSGLLKACLHSRETAANRAKRMDELVERYVVCNDECGVLDDRLDEWRALTLKGSVCRQVLMMQFAVHDYKKAIQYYELFTTHANVAHRFVADGDLFCTLIEGISCDARGYAATALMKDREEEGKDACLESVVLERIEYVEDEMTKHDVLPDSRVWYHWCMLAKRLKMPVVTRHVMDKMDAFMQNTKYFEFDFDLLQSVIEALYTNDEIDKALEYYDRYYREIKLFSHFELKGTGQREVDFHGFRSGFACVALQWILQNEYPPANISKYLLQQYGDKNPNVQLIIGQGIHNNKGTSVLHRAITQHIAKLSPPMQASTYPSNPGQLLLHGDDVVAWRKHNGYNQDVVHAKDFVPIKLFGDWKP